MPDFWQFPTVSMGLGPLMAIYQARFMKYLHDRGIADTDGPQGLGVLRRRRDGRAGVAGRDRPGGAREARQPDLRRSTATCSASTARCAATARSSRSSRADFRGAGWNVIKVIWGSLLGPAARARQGAACCARRMMEAVDGEYQAFKANDGAYVRKHFFGKYPELLEHGRRHERRGHLAPATAAATIRTRSTPPITPRCTTQGPADRDPRQDRQGLRHGRGGRRPRTSRTSRRRWATRTCARSATASSIPIPRRRARAERAVLQAGRRQRRR